MAKERLKIIPPVYLLIAVIAIVLARYFKLLQSFGYPYTTIGIPIFLLGLLFGGSAFLTFRVKKTALNPNDKSSKLVVSGPFKLSRNPMYVGMFLMLLGISIFLGNLAGMLISMVFALVINQIVIPFEERDMEKTFGKQFIEYKSKVRRWI